MSTQPVLPKGDKPFEIRRGRVDSVSLYEVKENELELLEKGSPANLQLNFAIFLLSIAFSSIIALTTTEVKWPIVKTFFVVVSVVGILMGAYLISCWYKTRTSIANVIQKIKDRIPENTIDNSIPANHPTPNSSPK